MAPPQVDAEYRQQIQKAREELHRRITTMIHYYPPLMLRLALHDAGIYDFTGNYLIKKGPNGSIRNDNELNHPINRNLKEAVDLCEEVKAATKLKITYADLYQLAGIVAVEVTGGPRIDFVPGREDSSLTQRPEEGILSNNKLDESQLMKFIERVGLEEKDIVALFGGLYQWGKSVEKPSGEGQEKREPLKFDNSYFIDLEKREPDNALLKGKFRQHVDKYAQDKEAFKAAYKAAHKKVSELGMSVAKSDQGGKVTAGSADAQPTSWNRNRVRLAQGIGIAVVTTAIILGFFLSRRSK